MFDSDLKSIVKQICCRRNYKIQFAKLTEVTQLNSCLIKIKGSVSQFMLPLIVLMKQLYHCIMHLFTL